MGSPDIGMMVAPVKATGLAKLPKDRQEATNSTSRRWLSPRETILILVPNSSQRYPQHNVFEDARRVSTFCDMVLVFCEGEPDGRSGKNF